MSVDLTDVTDLADKLYEKGVTEIEFGPGGDIRRVKLSTGLLAVREIFVKRGEEFWNAVLQFLKTKAPGDDN